MKRATAPEQRLYAELKAIMDDKPVNPQSTPPADDRYQLGERLEAENKRLTGVIRDHFVDQRSLCSSCKHATILRQHSRNARVIHCQNFDKRVPEDIAECTAYLAFGSLSLSQMADIATLIDDRPDRYRGYL